MQAKIGEEFAGMVTKVANFGLFVELKDVYVDGLLHVTALTNDYYHFDEVTHSLTGERSGQSFKLGDQLRVVVSHVNVEDRKIDLQLVGSTAPSKGVGRAIAKHKRAAPTANKGPRGNRRR